MKAPILTRIDRSIGDLNAPLKNIKQKLLKKNRFHSEIFQKIFRKNGEIGATTSIIKLHSSLKRTDLLYPKIKLRTLYLERGARVEKRVKRSQ
jgi:hypothetical protein